MESHPKETKKKKRVNLKPSVARIYIWKLTIPTFHLVLSFIINSSCPLNASQTWQMLGKKVELFGKGKNRQWLANKLSISYLFISSSLSLFFVSLPMAADWLAINWANCNCGSGVKKTALFFPSLIQNDSSFTDSSSSSSISAKLLLLLPA